MSTPSAKAVTQRVAQERSAQAAKDQEVLAELRKRFTAEMPRYRKELDNKATAGIEYNRSRGNTYFSIGDVDDWAVHTTGPAKREAWDRVVRTWVTAMRRKGYTVKAALRDAHYPNPNCHGREWAIELSWPLEDATKK
jgi:hypothetical protein